MSPTTKKYLMYGGAAVAVFVIYKMVKKPAAAAIAAAPPPAALDRSGLTIVPENVTKLSDAVEDLGLEQDLGSLGRSSIGRRYL